MSASVQKQGSDALAGGSVGWVLSRKPEGHGFNSQSGHVPRLQVRFPVGVHIGSSQSMFLSLFLLPFPLKKKKKEEEKKKRSDLSGAKKTLTRGQTGCGDYLGAASTVMLCPGTGSTEFCSTPVLFPCTIETTFISCFIIFLFF